MALFQQRRRRQTVLGCVLCNLKFVAPEDLQEIRLKPGQRLGEALVDQGYITQGQLEQALDVQARARGSGIDYASRMRDVVVEANQRTSGVLSALDDLESAAKRLVAKSVPYPKQR